VLAAGVVRVSYQGGVAAQELGNDPPASAVVWPKVAATEDYELDNYTVHIPAGAQEPLTTLVILHGIGGTGPDEARGLLQQTNALGWAVVAPTFRYGDWTDPSQLRGEDPVNASSLAGFLDQMPDLVNHSIQRRVFVYGFSRGGQTANRFALAYPDRVAGVALASCGTYTLPVASVGQGAAARPLPFPYGVSDFADIFGRPFDSTGFARVPVWIGVGGQDVNPSDVPHQWDPYIGNQRVLRAQKFANWLRELGIDTQVQVFPSLGHGESEESRAAAIGFLSSIDRS